MRASDRTTRIIAEAIEAVNTDMCAVNNPAITSSNIDTAEIDPHTGDIRITTYFSDDQGAPTYRSTQTIPRNVIDNIATYLSLIHI